MYLIQEQIKLKNFNILIIGSKGFIGSNLSRYLKQLEYKIIEADIVHDYGNPDYYILNPRDTEFDRIFKDNEIAVCVNCSGSALVKASFEDPLNDYKLNTLLVYRLLNSIRLYQPNCHFITLSSAAVYGNPSSLPIEESHPLNPLSPYGFHKMQAEEIVRFFHQQYQIQSTILRIFSAYGPGLKKQLFWDLYKKSKAHNKVSLFGTGEETRDFIYIDDLCQLIEQNINEKNSGIEVRNAASGMETRIADAVKYFYELLGFEGEYIFEKLNLEGYPIKWLANIEKSKKIGFVPGYTLKEGLKKYTEWLKELN